jgi:hypothetical protein
MVRLCALATVATMVGTLRDRKMLCGFRKQASCMSCSYSEQASCLSHLNAVGRPVFHNALYALAFLGSDSAAMAEQQQWFAGQARLPRPRHPHPEGSQGGVREAAVAEKSFLVACCLPPLTQPPMCSTRVRNHITPKGDACLLQRLAKGVKLWPTKSFRLSEEQFPPVETQHPLRHYGPHSRETHFHQTNC